MILVIIHSITKYCELENTNRFNMNSYYIMLLKNKDINYFVTNIEINIYISVNKYLYNYLYILRGY